MYDNAIQQLDSQRTMNPLNPMFYAEGITLAVVNPLTDLVDALYYDVCNGKKLDEKILNKIEKISPKFAEKLRKHPYTVIDTMASGGIRQIQNLKREASNRLNTLKPNEFKQYFKLITGQDYDPKKIEAYDEVTQMNCNVVAGGVTAQSIEEFINTPQGKDFLRACRDHCDGKIILW